MFRKLYGETEEDQLYYLGKKVRTTVIMTAVSIVAVLVWFILSLVGSYNGLLASIPVILYVVAVYMWGWGFMKAFFGITSFGAIFSGNVVISALIIFIYIFGGAILGMINFVVGTLRFIYLRVKHKKLSEV